MKNTDYNFSALSSYITTESSLELLKDMISDLDLELDAANLF